MAVIEGLDGVDTTDLHTLCCHILNIEVCGHLDASESIRLVFCQYESGSVIKCLAILVGKLYGKFTLGL